MKTTTSYGADQEEAEFWTRNQAPSHLEEGLSDSKARETAMVPALPAQPIEYQQLQILHSPPRTQRNSS